MKNAVFLTTYNRLPYLQQTLASWENVRGLERWHFVAMIEPSEIQEQVKEEFEEFFRKVGLTDYEIVINPERYGVLHHPWVGFESLFKQEFDFVVRAEDDLVVSDDILEFFEWAAIQFDRKSVATVHAFSHDTGYLDSVRLSQGFSPWLWGTWKDRWTEIIGPTWDHDYSTNNGVAGEQAGWDWNLNTRIFPKYDLSSACPVVSRADNIGVNGTHGNEANFVQSGHFQYHHDPVIFHEI